MSNKNFFPGDEGTYSLPAFRPPFLGGGRKCPENALQKSLGGKEVPTILRRLVKHLSL